MQLKSEKTVVWARVVAVKKDEAIRPQVCFHGRANRTCRWRAPRHTARNRAEMTFGCWTSQLSGWYHFEMGKRGKNI